MYPIKWCCYSLWNYLFFMAWVLEANLFGCGRLSAFPKAPLQSDFLETLLPLYENAWLPFHIDSSSLGPAVDCAKLMTSLRLVLIVLLTGSRGKKLALGKRNTKACLPNMSLHVFSGKNQSLKPYLIFLSLFKLDLTLILYHITFLNYLQIHKASMAHLHLQHGFPNPFLYLSVSMH